MATKAHPLNNVPLNWDQTVQQLFSAAFNQSTAIYQRTSLCGWRPLVLDPNPLHPHLAGLIDENDTQPAQNGSDVVILETNTEFTIEFDMPEIKEESLYLEVSGDTLIIRGERLSSAPQGPSDANNPHRGSLFQRFVQLPVSARPGQVRARLMGSTIRVNIKKPDHEP